MIATLAGQHQEVKEPKKREKNSRQSIAYRRRIGETGAMWYSLQQEVRLSLRDVFEIVSNNVQMQMQAYKQPKDVIKVNYETMKGDLWTFGIPKAVMMKPVSPYHSLARLAKFVTRTLDAKPVSIYAQKVTIHMLSVT